MALIDRLELATTAIEASGPGEWDRIERLVAERNLLCAQAHTCGLADLDRLRAVWERG